MREEGRGGGGGKYIYIWERGGSRFLPYPILPYIKIYNTTYCMRRGKIYFCRGDVTCLGACKNPILNRAVGGVCACVCGGVGVVNKSNSP